MPLELNMNINQSWATINYIKERNRSMSSRKSVSVWIERLEKWSEPLLVHKPSTLLELIAMGKVKQGYI